jgi:Fur family zinc uptake transcriptional regulator
MLSHSCNHHQQCTEEALMKAEMICRDHNLSLTPLRRKILRLIWEQGHCAIKAYDLLEKLKQDEPSAKPVTVYRTLDFLIENRLIHKIKTENSFIGCAHPTRQHQCAFLICDQCDLVEECCDNGKLLENISAHINAKTFQIQSITLEIHGLCERCIT